MVFTTNKPLSNWGKVLPDEDLAAAIVDRVLERGRFIPLDGVQEISAATARENARKEPVGNAARVDQRASRLTAANFSSKDQSPTPPPSVQVLKDATIGAFREGNPDVTHDGVTLTALTPGGRADQAGIKVGDVILAINDHYLFAI